MAGLSEATREDVYEAVSLPAKQFILWVTEGSDREGQSSHINPHVLRLASLQTGFSCTVKHWHEAEGVDGLLQQYRSQRVRKARKQTEKPNQTAAIVQEEKKQRAQLRDCLLEYAFEDASVQPPQAWVASLQTHTEEYQGTLKTWEKKVRKGIRNTTRQNNPALKKGNDVYTLHVQNDTSVTWGEVTDRLVEFAENRSEEAGVAEFGLRTGTMLELVRQIKGAVGGVGLEFQEHANPSQLAEVALALGRSLPVAVVTFGDMVVVYDLHELGEQEWLDLINEDVLDLERQQRNSNKKAASLSTSAATGCNGNSQSAGSKNPGATPLYKRFPTLIPTVCAFVKEAGMAAQDRRRTTTATVGCSLGAIRKHVLSQLPEINNWGGISEDSIGRLFVAPHEGRTSKKYYKALIEARVPGKSDNLRKNNRNFHACRAQLKAALEMGMEYHDECICVSGDGKAKLAVGKMAVSKFVRLRRFCMVGDGPKNLDHDYVVAHSWSLSTTGMIVLEPDIKSGGSSAMGKSTEPACQYQDDEEKNPFRLTSEEQLGGLVTTQARARRAMIMNSTWQSGDESHDSDDRDSKEDVEGADGETEEEARIRIDVYLTSRPSDIYQTFSLDLPSHYDNLREILDIFTTDEEQRGDRYCTYVRPRLRAATVDVRQFELIKVADDSEFTECIQLYQWREGGEIVLDVLLAWDEDEAAVAEGETAEEDADEDEADSESRDSRPPVTSFDQLLQNCLPTSFSSSMVTTVSEYAIRRTVLRYTWERLIDLQEPLDPVSDPECRGGGTQMGFVPCFSSIEAEFQADLDALGYVTSDPGDCFGLHDTPSPCGSGCHDSNGVAGPPSDSVPIVFDEHGRKHVEIPNSGPVYLKIRSTKHNPTTSYTNYRDFSWLLELYKKKNAVISVDGGLDYTCRSLVNVFFYGKLFFEAQLDSLTVAQNAADHSVYNYWIERTWSWASSQLIGVCLPGTLPRHGDLTPAQFHAHEMPSCTSECKKNREKIKTKMAAASSNKKRKSDDSRRANKAKKTVVPCTQDCRALKAAVTQRIQEEEKEIFQIASEELASYWHGKFYDGHEVHCELVSEGAPKEALAELDLLYRYLKCTDAKKMRDGGEFEQIHSFFVRIFQHLKKKTTHMLSFQAGCGFSTCDHPACNGPVSSMLQAMKKYNMPFVPTENPDFQGHFFTYLQLKERGGLDQDPPDRYVKIQRRPGPLFQPPTCKYTPFDQHNCAGVYTMASKSEETRHYKLFHPHGEHLMKIQTNQPRASTRMHRHRPYVYCRFQLLPSFYCNEVFPDWRALKKHHQRTGHYQQGSQKSPFPGIPRAGMTETQRKKAARARRKEARKKKSRPQIETPDPRGVARPARTSRIAQTHDDSSSSNEECTFAKSKKKKTTRKKRAPASSKKKAEASSKKKTKRRQVAKKVRPQANIQGRTAKTNDTNSITSESASFSFDDSSSKSRVSESHLSDSDDNRQIAKGEFVGVHGTNDEVWVAQVSALRPRSRTASCNGTVIVKYMEPVAENAPDGCWKRYAGRGVEVGADTILMRVTWTACAQKAGCQFHMGACQWKALQASLQADLQKATDNRRVDSEDDSPAEPGCHISGPFTTAPTSKTATATATAAAAPTNATAAADADSSDEDEDSKEGVEAALPAATKTAEEKAEGKEVTNKCKEKVVQVKGKAEAAQGKAEKTEEKTSHKAETVEEKAAEVEKKEQTEGQNAERGEKQAENQTAVAEQKRDTSLRSKVESKSSKKGEKGDKVESKAARGGKEVAEKQNSTRDKAGKRTSKTDKVAERRGPVVGKVDKTKAQKPATERQKEQAGAETAAKKNEADGKAAAVSMLESTAGDAAAAAAAATATNIPVSTLCRDEQVAVCAHEFENGSKGIQLYRIIKVDLEQKTFTGRRLRPSKPGMSTNDPSCLYTRWQSFGKPVECACRSVLCCFDLLDSSKKIPGYVVQQLLLLAGVFEQNQQPGAITPTKIVKTRLAGPSQEYLVTNQDGDYTWIAEGSPAACTSLFANLLMDWTSPRVGAPVEEKSRKSASETTWCTAGSYRLTQRDQQLLENGGPLNQAIMDAVMTKLALLTRRFRMSPCLCPVDGYKAVDPDHAQVHHCGSYSHWVFSMRLGGAIWYGDFQGQPIPPSVVVELVDLYSSQVLDRETEVRVLRLPPQQLTSTCGVLVLLAIYIAIVSVIQEQAADPTTLCDYIFDEVEGGKWVQELLCSTSTAPLLSDQLRKAAVLTPNRPSPRYKTHTIQPHIVARITSGLLRGSPVESLSLVVGHGNPPASTLSHYKTADAQAARLRLVSGCVIQIKPLVHAVGNWLVEKVTQTYLQATPFNPPSSESNLLPSLHLDLRSSVLFLVSGPPPMRSLRFSALTEYQTSQPRRVMFIYPVRQGRLSNTVFMTAEVNEYFVVEAEPCQDRFDVECLMKIMEGRSVRAQVRIEDLLPLRALESYYPDVEITTAPDVYRQIVMSLMQEHGVVLESDLFTPSVITSYPEEMSTDGKGLPQFHNSSILEVRRRLRSTGDSFEETEVAVPHISGAVVTFQSATAQCAFDWALRTAEAEHPAITASFPLRVRRAIDPGRCLDVCVMRHRVVQTCAGISLSPIDAHNLGSLSKQVVRCIESHARSVYDKQKPPSFGQWSQLLDPTFGCYQLRLCVDTTLNCPMVADVKGCDAAHDPALSTVSALQTKGLVACGGQKLVLCGNLMNNPQPTPVVLYKLRDPTLATAVAEFQTEIAIWAALQDTVFVPKLVYTDNKTPKLWAVGEQLFGTVRHWLRGNSAPGERLRVLASCATALSEMHSRRLLHRDVKPSNFLYDTATHEAKLSDFGLAVFLTDSNPCTTGSVGTLSFKAPEVFQGQYGLPADVFSFGVCMWELLAGTSRAALMRKLYGQLEQSQTENQQYSSLEAFLQSEVAKRPLKLSQQWGREVQELVTACTQSTPEQRPSMKEVAERLGATSRASTSSAAQKSQKKRLRLKPTRLEFDSALSESEPEK